MDIYYKDYKGEGRGEIVIYNRGEGMFFCIYDIWIGCDEDFSLVYGLPGGMEEFGGQRLSLSDVENIAKFWGFDSIGSFCVDYMGSCFGCWIKMVDLEGFRRIDSEFKKFWIYLINKLMIAKYNRYFINPLIEEWDAKPLDNYIGMIAKFINLGITRDVGGGEDFGMVKYHFERLVEFGDLMEWEEG